ncbi:formyl transferase, partial [Mesorhizobium sp. M2D.F.Ca.ET.145.01.1.1]
MQVSLRLDSDCLRAFHLLLLQRLAALANVEVSVDARPRGSGVPGGIAALFQLETVIHGLPADGLAKRLPLSALAPYRTQPRAAPDLVLDLCGDTRQ